MTVAWITWRDLDVVRGQMDAYLANLTKWREHSQGWLLERAEPASLSNLLLSQEFDENDEEPGSRMSVSQAARHELWGHLLNDRLRAEGRDINTGRRAVIPACEWYDLGPYGGSRHPNSVRSYDKGRTLSGYDDVLVRRDDVLKLWPETPAVEQGQETDAAGFRDDEGTPAPEAPSRRRSRSWQQSTNEKFIRGIEQALSVLLRASMNGVQLPDGPRAKARYVLAAEPSLKSTFEDQTLRDIINGKNARANNLAQLKGRLASFIQFRS